MKLTKLFPIVVSFVLPLSIVSCGDKEEEKKTEGTSESVKTADSHEAIASEISTIMNEMMDGIIAIKDAPSANAFGEKMDGYVSSLKDLLAKAKALPAPTAEEKAAVQKVKDASDEKGMEMMKAMGALQENPDAEAIGKVIGQVMTNQDMETTMDAFEELYELKDSSGPGEPGE